MLKAVTVDGEVIYVVEGQSLESPDVMVKYAIRREDLGRYIQCRQYVLFAQFLTLVNDGLILTRHCFQGLRRNLFNDGSENGDKGKYVFSRKPGYDYVWSNGRTGEPKQLIAPAESVFLTIVTKNEKHTEKFPDIAGWIERWSWETEDKGPLPESPVGWVDRYDQKIWTRK